MIDHQVEEIDMLDSQARLVLGDVLQQETNMLPDAKLVLGWIVEDEEGDFIAEALPARNSSEVIRGRTWFNRSLRASLMGSPGCNGGHNVHHAFSGS